MSPPLQPERKQGLAARPGSADIRRLLWADVIFQRRVISALGVNRNGPERKAMPGRRGEDECAKQREPIGLGAADGGRDGAETQT